MLREGSDVTLCTLYRVLTEFVRAGLACTLTSGAGKQLYEGNDQVAHHHLSCVRCGDVTEVFDQVLTDAQARVAAAYRFASCGAGLALHGLCERCVHGDVGSTDDAGGADLPRRRRKGATDGPDADAVGGDV